MKVLSMGLVLALAACEAADATTQTTEGAQTSGTESASTTDARGAPVVLPRALHPAAAHGLVRLGAYALTASAQYRGLQVYRVDAPDRIALVRDLVTDVEPFGLRADKDRAYAPAGHDGVLVFDVSDPGRPTTLARLATQGVATDVAPFAAGGRRYLAVAESPQGLRIFDVTNARAAVDLGAVDPGGGSATAVLVQGSLAVLANAPRAEVSLSSLADPAHPRLLSTTSVGREAFALAMAGNVLYVALGFSGVSSFDVTDPAHPAAIAHADGAHGPCQFNCKDPFLGLTLDGDRLWVVAREARVQGFALDGRGGMVLANTIPVAGSALAIVPEGRNLFVGAEEGLVVFPRDATDGTPPTWFDRSGHGTVYSLARAHDGVTLYAAASVRGVKTFATVTPFAPLLLDRATTPGTRDEFDVRAAQVLAAPGTLFVGDGRAGLATFAAPRPRTLVERGSAPATDQIEAMQRAGDKLFVCDDNSGLSVFDVANLRAPRAIAHLSLDPPDMACVSLQLSGSLLYIGGGAALGVADVHDPAHPVLLGQTSTPERARFVALALAAGGRALLAVGTFDDPAGPQGRTTRLHVFDLADPVHPRAAFASAELGGTPLRDAIAVAVAGKVAYVAAKDAGIQVFDISAPLAPVRMHRIATPGAALGIVATRAALYVAQGEGGLGVVSLKGAPCHDRDDDGDDDHEHAVIVRDHQSGHDCDGDDDDDHDHDDH